MNFNDHSRFKGMHAFLSASQYHWLNYDRDKLIKVYQSSLSMKKGTELHEFASRCIELNQKLPRNKNTLNMYVNDAIGYRMTPEQVLFYSENCFGTADSICFRDNLLRIHDLKTGSTPTHMEQLEIYASLFCLEYFKNPNVIDIELRIYQNNDVLVYKPEGNRIESIMQKIKDFDKCLVDIKEREIN